MNFENFISTRRYLNKGSQIGTRMFGRLLAGPTSLLISSQFEELFGPENEADRNDCFTILALTPERFRGDLEILAKSGRFRIVAMPKHWQHRIIATHIPPTAPWDAYFPNREPNGFDDRWQKSRKVARDIFSRLFLEQRIDCVVSCALHYIQDYVLGVAAADLGTPFVVLHRESLHASKKRKAFTQNQWSKIAPFEGTHVVVHNKQAMDTFVDSGFVPGNKISARGCMRMDEYIEKINRHKTHAKKHDRVTFFSFYYGIGGVGAATLWNETAGNNFKKLFDQTHLAFARTAKAYPDTEFVIKLKWGDGWLRAVHELFARNDVDISSIPNLIVDFEGDAQDFVLTSDVVIAFGSTAIPESGITGIPVIIPMFEEAATPDQKNQVFFQGEMDGFLVAESCQEFETMIEEQMKNPHVSDAMMTARNLLFERWVSSLDANATDRYIDLLETLIENR
jgi:hypothetical protein